MESIDARLYLLFTPALCRGDPWATLEDAIAGGVELVQWRIKRRDPEGARLCLRRCRELGVPLIVNDDVALSIELGAAGAHLGQEDEDATAARARLGPDRILGVSTHDLDQVHRAVAAGADYLGFGPMFPTATKGYREGQPQGALRRAVAAAGRPVFAIGGIDGENVAHVVAEGCRRIAVSSAILTAADPRRAAAALRGALSG